MQTLLDRFGTMRRRFRWLSAVTLVIFAGMLITGFQNPLIGAILGVVNVAIYFSLIRPSLKRYNELYIEQNALTAIGRRMDGATYTARVGVDVSRFDGAGLFPSCFKVDAPLFAREISASVKRRGERFNVRVSQVTFRYRRDGEKRKAILYGAWIEADCKGAGECRAVLSADGIPDTRFTQSDFVREGWHEAACDDGYACVTGDGESKLPDGAAQAWSALYKETDGNVVASAHPGRVTIFLPGRFYAIHPPLQYEITQDAIAADRLPEMDAALKLVEKWAGA